MMIEYDWLTELDEDAEAEVNDVLARAASYDAEAEYNTIEAADVRAALQQRSPASAHLMIRMSSRQDTLDGPYQPDRLAGIIRLAEGEDGWAQATLVIDPDLRSIGIMTQLLEQIGVDPSGPDGWAGSGFHRIRAWARGNHPASGRIGRRNRLRRARRVWKLVRPTGRDDLLDAGREYGFEAGDAPSSDGDAPVVLRLVREGAPTGASVTVDLRPAYIEEIGRCASVVDLTAPEQADEAPLLAEAAREAARAGLDGIAIHVDSIHEQRVADCRRLGFQHDRTDVLYELAGPENTTDQGTT